MCVQKAEVDVNDDEENRQKNYEESGYCIPLSGFHNLQSPITLLKIKNNIARRKLVEHNIIVDFCKCNIYIVLLKQNYLALKRKSRMIYLIG